MAPPTGPLNLDVEAISGILGSVSIACWVVVFSPQIIQNFQRSSADGLSIQFIIIWLLGDIFNILGAVLQGVLPTMTILAVYYTIADLVLLMQCFYYRGFTWKDEAKPPPRRKVTVRDRLGEPNERTGLLSPHHQPDFERERRGSDWSNLSPAVPFVPEDPARPPPPPTLAQSIFRNTVAVVMVCGAGVLGWYLSPGSGSTGSDEPSTSPSDQMAFSAWGQVFGYLCAALYILSRLPQLVLNWRRKSTDGLSMLFFLFACLGNITYVLSILVFEPHCEERRCRPGEARAIYGRYMLVNLSWLCGSVFTLLLDLGVFVQYFMYGSEQEEDESDEEAETNEDEERPLLARGDSTFG